MATNRMLIDASHPEETRVAVLHGDRLEGFDVEVATRKQLKGNIYLAKVTRVEPSLQAAFVDYGGNRHGFLAFNEIHPDYYQIPVADREALLAEQQAAQKVADDEVRAGGADAIGAGRRGLEVVGGDDADEVEVRRHVTSARNYRIQEVIKARQILLVQVVKEERGTKGAALTTYLSLAGRYCVLMPNSARGGGVSRKITSGTDRRRLKEIVSDLDLVEGMGVIVRTAGAERNKAEIKRDYDYLLRQWGTVRELTLKSIAPTLVYEEANLIKRSIRDMYSRDIEEIIVDGDECFRTAREFMKLLMPSHAKRVKAWPEDKLPLFQSFNVESQLTSMHSPQVQLRSGGYIIINPTEALVAIDVNSGRATRERNIEETALKTNLEAADEIARHLRLRDLAGLVVIDFIDMELSRNQVQVERRLKDTMRGDRARIQLGRISPFGLLELSRQRLRPSVFETSFEPCPFCRGSGIRRSTESAALHVLRGVEDEGVNRPGGEMTVHVARSVALYILNRKRAALDELEKRYQIQVRFEVDETLVPSEFRIERPKGVQAAARDKVTEAVAGEGARAGEAEGKRRRRRRSRRHRREDEAEGRPAEVEQAPSEAEKMTAEGAEPVVEAEPAIETAAPEAGGKEAADDGSARRRRRGRRGGRRRGRRSADDSAAQAAPIAATTGAEAPSPADETGVVAVGPEKAGNASPVEHERGPQSEAGSDEPPARPAGRRPRSRRRRPVHGDAKVAEQPADSPEPAPAAWNEAAPSIPEPEPTLEGPASAAAAEGAKEPPAAEGDRRQGEEIEREQPGDTTLMPPRPPRRGWWRRNPG